MDTFVWGNIAINAALTGTVAFFIKHWMSMTEKTVKDTANALSSVTTQHTKEIAEVTEKNREVVRMTAKELSADAKETSAMIVSRLEALTEQVRIANGRTSRNETQIKIQETRCEERSKRKDACQD